MECHFNLHPSAQMEVGLILPIQLCNIILFPQIFRLCVSLLLPSLSSYFTFLPASALQQQDSRPEGCGQTPHNQLEINDTTVNQDL